MKHPFRKVVAFALIFIALSGHVSRQQTDKIQEAVNSIKTAYYCQDQDYHTDGERTVWVKSYKKWVPQDIDVMKKEAPHVLVFLTHAIEHNRYDVLEQLLPDYYRTRGGTKAFAGDILRASSPNTPQSNK